MVLFTTRPLSTITVLIIGVGSYQTLMGTNGTEKAIRLQCENEDENRL